MSKRKEKPDYQKKIDEQRAEERRSRQMDYSKVAFMLKKPYSNSIFKGPFRIRDKSAHKDLVAIALKRGLYVWYCAIKEVEGKQCAVGHHIIEWDSVPDTPPKPGVQPEDKLKCPKCGKRCSSTSGLTLHKKTCKGKEHKLKLECDCGRTFTTSSGLTLHQKTCPKMQDSDESPEESTDDALVCDVCGKRCSSSSGLTLHRKTHGNND